MKTKQWNDLKEKIKNLSLLFFKAIRFTFDFSYPLSPLQRSQPFWVTLYSPLLDCKQEESHSARAGSQATSVKQAEPFQDAFEIRKSEFFYSKNNSGSQVLEGSLSLNCEIWEKYRKCKT